MASWRDGVHVKAAIHSCTWSEFPLPWHMYAWCNAEVLDQAHHLPAGVLSQTLVSSTAAPVVLASPQPGSPVPVATAVPIVTPSPR